MEIVYIINTILQSFAISLGVGSSTIAIVQFFVAIKDGNISDEERKMMGVVYFILRLAMGVILFTTLVQVGLFYYLVGDWSFISPFMMAIWTVVGVIFLNAIAMTLHYMPSKFGPAIQAGSWYSLGFLIALIPLGLITFTYVQFAAAYAGVLLLSIATVNTVMMKLKK